MSIASLPPQLEQYQRSQLHRETYIGTLNSLLRDQGAKRLFAQKLNISPQYLSYILDPWGHRVPSNELAIKIVEIIPVEFSERKELLHHIVNSRSIPQYQHKPGAYLDRDSIAYVMKVATRSQKEHDGSPEQALQAYRRLYNIGKWAIFRMKAGDVPEEYTNILIYMHDAANALNLPVNALWNANNCLHTCQNDEYWQTADAGNRIWLWINSYRIISASYNNLQLPKKALEYAKKALTFAQQNAPNDIFLKAIPHITRDLLNAYANMPRFAISDAESIALSCLNVMGSRLISSRAIDGLATLVQRSLIDVYIQHNSKRSLLKARNLIEDSFYNGNINSLGVLPKTLHLRTRATLSHALGDRSAYQDCIQDALVLAQKAGLLHQQAEIQQEMGQYLS